MMPTATREPCIQYLQSYLVRTLRSRGTGSWVLLPKEDELSTQSSTADALSVNDVAGVVW